MRIGERGRCDKLGEELHIVRLAFNGVGEHEVCSWDWFGRPRRGDGCGQHLVDRSLLDSEHYVGRFKGLVDSRASLEVVGNTKRPSFAVLNEHVYAGGLEEVVDGIRC